MGSVDALRAQRAVLIGLLRRRSQGLDYWDIELKFPIEFKIEATPLSLQASPASKGKWKHQVKEAARDAAGHSTWATSSPVFVTIFYFPFGPMQGDVDNIVKLILDGMIGPIYESDRQVHRVIVQKFEPETFVPFENPTSKLDDAVASEPPVVYIRIDNDSTAGN